MEDRIKNLSLDQKAKLYFMGLVRQGKIDTLPEDPKAAYVSMMMDKDDYGRSVSGKDKRTFMEPEDMTMAARARKMAGMEETRDEEDEENDRNLAVDDIPDSLRELSTELGYLNEESNQYQKVTFIYTEQGGHFYGLDVYASKDQPQRSAKLKYDEANEWLKGVLEYIHEGDLIPRRYNSGMEDLDLIVARLEELGIEASHGDYMDVS